MYKYVVFDVETPNRENNRMSAIGISVIENGKIEKEFYSLVNPETYFDYFNTQLTGISEELVEDAPNFAELWEEIEPIMSSGILAAHNAPFDLGVLKRCLEVRKDLKVVVSSATMNAEAPFAGYAPQA